ncbi:TRAP transporter small permease [Pokkaliibacter sp. CJK22405]|uniref:TRAP transporter small permease n=1 Tax=Pokkaliibacter sp. CJK22405 TaxID=3384615 RepID=UPI003984B657
MRVLRLLERRFEEFLCSLMMAGIAILLNLEVIRRYVFNSPSSWSDEVCRTLMICIVFIGVPWAVKTNSHVIIDLIPVSNRKLRGFFEILSKIIFMVFCGFFITSSVSAIEFHHMLGSETEGLQLPYWIMLMVLPLSFGLTILRLLQSIVESYRHTMQTPASDAEVQP